MLSFKKGKKNCVLRGAQFFYENKLLNDTICDLIKI